ncbi:phage minor head protein [Rhizorhabdus histidinilytica]|uniref:Phage putative head morphogenesis protein, SPP1 gp7 family n=1 Tax=Rhizorhabdus histidinilytica TaxID=439228 RepID=A0A1T5BPS3_9SPHN|nr:phage minor head protein [Rhizorhabdus histidinilytica]SKB48873.1 phage putative head morphogenesis protein, SPP1 gp7 family [Rhizorhabdus histidinilytica]
MAYSLAALVRHKRNPRRKQIVIRDIRPPQMLASDLYRSSYARVCAAWEAAIPRIMAEYERSVPVRDASANPGKNIQILSDSASDLGDLFRILGDELTRLILDIIPELRDWTFRTDRWHRDQWRGAVLSATGVDIETILYASGTPTTVGETLAWNTALIKDVSDQTRQRISSAVFAGLQARKPAREVAAQIRDAVGMSRRRSQLIASDQLAKLASGLDSERMHDAGISQFKYRHSGKLHARKWHRARDGKLYELETGEQVEGPDDIARDDMPGVPPYCGCRKQAVLTFD